MLPRVDWTLSSYVRDRITKKNRNWLAVFCGETGSGKSYSAMTVAKNIDPTFNIKRVVFRMKDFMELLNSGTLRRGDCIVFDEAGVGMPAREWYTISNKAIGYLLQTFRNMNLAVIFTVPNLSYIDGQARGLFHNYIETKKILKKQNKVRAKLFNISTDPKSGKAYFIYPKIKKPGQYKKIQIKELYISMPPKELVEAYEAKKRGYTLDLNTEIGRKMDCLEREARTGRPSKLGAKEMAFIVGQSSKGRQQLDILSDVNKKFGLELSQGTISNVLRRAGVSKRRLSTIT